MFVTPSITKRAGENITWPGWTSGYCQVITATNFARSCFRTREYNGIDSFVTI
jgi:hypothetical protein